MRACAVCGEPVPTRKRGRPAVYCSRSCQAKAYRVRKAKQRPDGGMSSRQAARLAAFHAGLILEAALADGWEALDRYGADRSRVEAALRELRAELERRAEGLGRARTRRSDRDENSEPVRVSVAPFPARTVSRSAAVPPVRDENPVSVTESEQERREREWEEQAAAEQAEFERRLRPVPEFGEGYQMAEWPGTGRYYLVYQGERIGHAAKKGFTSVWEAFTAYGVKVPFTGTYKTRRQALIQVALHHQDRMASKSQRR